VPSGDRERAVDRQRWALGAYDRGELRLETFNLSCKLNRWEQLGPLSNDGGDGLSFLRREAAGADVVEQVSQSCASRFRYTDKI
jgi:hypothetical protein